MARGAEAKLRRRNRKKAGEATLNETFGDNDDARGEELPMPTGRLTKANVEDDDDDDDDQPEEIETLLPKQKNKKNKQVASLPPSIGGGSSGGIKTVPLILLIMMVGTTVLPALIFAGDYISSILSKNDIAGSIGYRLGIGTVPRKRVFSFYEKHAPEKLDDVPKILSKHYGDYPLLIKKLERKYQDYGYFMGWQDDEAPLRLAKESLQDMYNVWITDYWNRYAPQVIKTAARNVRYNLTFLFKKGRRIWKKHAWPLLEPIFGVPRGTEAQKRKDAAEARRKKRAPTGGSSTTKKRNRDFRDDVEED